MLTEYSYVTGFAKTVHYGTNIKFNFIASAYSYIQVLSIHSVLNGLVPLVCFSGGWFADHAKSRLRQWHHWRAPIGWHGAVTLPTEGQTSQRPNGLFWQRLVVVTTLDSVIWLVFPPPSPPPPPPHPPATLPPPIPPTPSQCWPKISAHLGKNVSKGLNSS